jgi:hypothetical protein
VECLNHQGDMLLAQSDKEAGRAVAPNNYTWFTGRWGTDLRKTDFQPNSFIPSYLCSFAPFGDAIYKAPPEDQPAGAAMITPLLSSVEVNGREVPLQAGMAVTAEINTGRRRVIEYLMSPLLEHVHESMRER